MSRASLPSLSFRSRLVLGGVALVALTTALMVIPLFVASRDQAESVYRERLTAVAHGASDAIHGDTVELLIASTSRIPIPYVVVRNALQAYSWRRGDSSRVSADDGLAIVVKDGTGFRVIAHGDWPILRPQARVSWLAPTGLSDSLGNIRAGVPALWWFTDATRFVAVAPVFAGTVPVALVVAAVPRSAAVAESRHAFRRLIWFPALAALIAIGLAVVLASQLTGRVERLAAQAAVLATGDLRVDIADSGRDEFGVLARALRDLVAQLRGVLVDVRTNATTIGGAIGELSAGSLDMRAATDQVAAAARVIAQSAVGQTTDIRSISSLAQGAAEQAQEVTGYAERAASGTTRIVDAARRVSVEARGVLDRMTAMQAMTAEAVPAVAALAAKSRRITEVAAAVAQLADQAQLLSLNAAIEAARAGAHGRGFGVVAHEMRRLAESTNAALDAIQEFAGGIESDAERTGTRMVNVRASVSEGAAAMESSARSLRDILEAAEAGGAAASAIAAHAAAQESRTSAVAIHVASIAAAATENAGMAQQVSAAADAQGAIADTVASSAARLGVVATDLQRALERFEL